MGYADFFRDYKEAGLEQRGQIISGFTNTMVAALGANAAVVAMRYPVSATGLLYVPWMHLHYTCLGSFTTPVTAGRRLTLRRGSGADASGGTALDVVRKKSDVSSETVVTGRIADTAALTTTGITFESSSMARLMLAHVGLQGGSYDEVWAFDDTLTLKPGELLGLLAGQAFDAGGTWQLNWKAQAVEVS
jgi:hypothetical protein